MFTKNYQMCLIIEIPKFEIELKTQINFEQLTSDFYHFDFNKLKRNGFIVFCALSLSPGFFFRI